MVDLNKVVTDAVRKVSKEYGLDEQPRVDVTVEIPVTGKKIGKKTLDEAYVATPKPYKQVSEFVSQKTKDAHSELYQGYIESVNKVSNVLDSVDTKEASSQHSDIRSLKLDETFNLNAVWLHELFFANCFDPSSQIYMDSMAFMRLQRDFGTFDDWQADFIACAKSCGEGWAVCGYNMFLKRYVNTIVSHHSCDVQVGLYPIIVLDMWSHAYFRDYLTDKGSYITAMMRELNWVVIEERVNTVTKFAEIMK